MDLATLVGLVGAIGCIVGAIAVGGGFGSFVNVPGLLIVLGGTSAVTLMRFPLAHTLGSFKVAMKAFLHKGESPDELIKEGVKLAGIARKEGLLGLESVEIRNPFLKRGIQLAIDGHEPDFVSKVLSTDMNVTIARHEQGQATFKAIADSAPAMGMIGTLIGLVQMMANMDDPKTLGPAMAVALLTTLYGAVLANAIAQPIQEKLAMRSTEETLNKSIVIEAIQSIQAGLNPRVMEDLLKTYLPSAKREEAVPEAA